MAEGLQLGRYSVFAELASGGMATVYLGRMTGAVGFGRTVAIKRLHPHLAKDPDFVSMFLDEARLAARVQHPNVVPIIDVVSTDRELFLVLEYVKGETLGSLLRASVQENLLIPVPVGLSILVDVLNGLHAAHEARDEQGVALEIVHRDVSPQNVIVGADGVSRLLDFGVAKAASRLQTTREGQIKGKVSYMAPEQITGQATRQSDIYAAGVVLWEVLALRRLFAGDNEGQLLHAVLFPKIVVPSWHNPECTPELDAVALKALSLDPEQRFGTAREMALALDACMRPASSNQVAEWLESMAGPSLLARSQLVSECESHSGNTGRTEVRKLLEMDPALLALAAAQPVTTVSPAIPPTGEAPGAILGGPLGTGASVVNASLSLRPAPLPPAFRARPWMLVLGGAALAAAASGVFVLAERESSRAAASSPPAQPPHETQAATPPPLPPAPAITSTPAPTAQPPTVDVESMPVAPPTPEAAVSAPLPAAARGGKKPGAPGQARSKGAGNPAAGDMNSLLDSH